MKKIININLSGRVIPIEDSAYEKLQAYVESLRRYFANEIGRDEIINDIESRIAELMNEKIRKGADRITDADVDEIIASMGRPEDFEADETSTTQQTKSQQEETAYTGYTEKRGRRRLYRDSSDKFIGGVCSGIANYLNVDPDIVRILFAIVTFGGFGLGFLIYILLWIILPSKDIEGFSGKRLYRNPDDRVIGGVAGGLAAYFNMRASTLRLIFAAPILLNIFFSILNGFSWRYDFHIFPNIFFGSLSGTFFLAYIILWIVLPEARSQYEKMEMRGEKVDVNTISQNVKEGIQQTKDRLKDWGSEVKESAQNFSNKAKEFANTRGKVFANEARQTVRRTGNGLGHAIGVIFKVFFLFVAGSIAFGLFVAFIVLIFGGIAWWPVNNFLWTSKWQQLYAWGTLIFFFGIPLIAFITWIIRRILRVRSRSGYLGWTFGGLWIIGWIAATLFAASISKDLREYEHNDAPVSITQPAHGRMIVKVSEPQLEYTGNFAWINDESTGWDLSEDTLKLSAIRFDVELSEDSDYHVMLKKYSAGRTRTEAKLRADKIKYDVFYKDSVLDIGSGYAVDKDSKFRGQKIEMEIGVPAGKKIRFDGSVEDRLNPFNIRIRRYRGWRNGVNIEMNESNGFPWNVNTDYIMGKDGLLRSADGTTARTNNDYRYKQPDSSDIDKTIEQKEKELNDLKEKKKKQEEKTPGKPIGYLQNRFDNIKTDAVVIGPSPIFSLVNTFN
ncbi:MAG TPA: PspC domain-containing protein [Chitinophagaceae bacterium]|nr:PspC domain-containing protein [Chitinophagaceae bacterium]